MPQTERTGSAEFDSEGRPNGCQAASAKVLSLPSPFVDGFNLRDFRVESEVRASEGSIERVGGWVGWGGESQIFVRSLSELLRRPAMDSGRGPTRLTIA